MGILRLVLAISVLALHCGPILGNTLVGGRVAVQAFYLISGFYMALVLSSKYKGEGKYGLFVSNRLLKLFPTYLICLLGTIVVGLIAHLQGSNFFFSSFIEGFHELTPRLKFFVILSNLMILGQDSLFFIGFDVSSSSSFLQLDYKNSSFPLHHFLIIGQAWTVSLEIMFYLIAPFINRWKTRHLLMLALISLLGRLCFAYVGLSEAPWDYQFFPFELAFFVTGMLCYRFYIWLQNREDILVQNRKLVLGLLLALIFLYQWIPVSKEFSIWVFYVLFSFSLPFIFSLTKNNPLDRAIGELSYPLYLSHILIGRIVSQLISTEAFFYGFIVTIASIAFSWFINQYIIINIETFRQKRTIIYENRN